MAVTIDVRTVVTRQIPGTARREQLITLELSTVSAGDEVEIPGVFTRGTRVFLLSTLVSGTGTTHQVNIGNTTGFTDNTQAHQPGKQATAKVHDKDASQAPYNAPGGSLFFKPGVDAGSDNVVHTQMTIIEGEAV